MVCIIKTVSLKQEEADFLKDYKLSPTSLLKEKIWEMKGMITTVHQKKIEKMNHRIQELCEVINKQEELINKHGILEKETTNETYE